MDTKKLTVEQGEVSGDSWLLIENGEIIASFLSLHSDNEANAREAAKAIHFHDDLIALLRDAVAEGKAGSEWLERAKAKLQEAA